MKSLLKIVLIFSLSIIISLFTLLKHESTYEGQGPVALGLIPFKAGWPIAFCFGKGGARGSCTRFELLNFAFDILVYFLVIFSLWTFIRFLYKKSTPR